MRLLPNTPVTVDGLPGIWIALHSCADRPGWWRIVPKISTPGLVALASCGTIDVRRKDIHPLAAQETLL